MNGEAFCFPFIILGCEGEMYTQKDSVLQIIMKKIFPLLFLLISTTANTQTAGLKAELVNKQFKIRIPFDISPKGIMVSSIWGAKQIKLELLWDNNSPTWLNNILVSNDPSFTRARNTFYSTTTADGTPINGNVYNCDSARIGNLAFKNVSLYEIPNSMDGVIGENMITTGVWEINFLNKIITFSSDIDSLDDRKEANLVKTHFKDGRIKMKVLLRKRMLKDIEIDFGQNGGILLPISAFFSLAFDSSKTYKKDLLFTTPSGKNIVQSIISRDTIFIGNNPHITIISTNELVKEKLLGLGFFTKFEFVIFDYKKKQFYVSKRVR